MFNVKPIRKLRRSVRRVSNFTTSDRESESDSFSSSLDDEELRFPQSSPPPSPTTAAAAPTVAAPSSALAPAPEATPTATQVAAGGAAQALPVPAAAARPGQLTDAQLLKLSQKRWQAISKVHPQSRRFRRRYDFFQNQLRRRQNPHALISGIFSKHEREQLYAIANQPSKINKNPIRLFIQNENTLRYHELLARPPWDVWRPNANVAFKLTLASFGIPVAPIMDASLTEIDLSQPLPNPPEDAKKADPLRFLNGYVERAHGQDWGARGELFTFFFQLAR